jgi:hypothetical protein
MPDPVSGLIAGGSILGSSLIQGRASKKASEAQAEGAAASTQAQLEMLYKARKDLAPWREAGMEAVERLMTGGLIEEAIAPISENVLRGAPGYQFRLSEGINALDKSAISRGRLFSGAQQKAITRFGQDYASAEYDREFNRRMARLSPWFKMAGMGQGVAGQSASMAMDVGRSIGQNALYAGEARASNYINQGNIWSNAISKPAELYFYNRGQDKILSALSSIKG